MSADIIRALAKKVLLAQVAARNVKDVDITIDAISTRIRFDGEGEIYVVDKNGQRDDSKTFGKFLDEVRVDRPDLFKDAGPVNTVSHKNPFVKGPSFSITNQMILINSNPDLATKFKAEAEAKQ